MKRFWVLATIFFILSVAGFIFMQWQLDREKPSKEQLKERLIYIPEGRFIRTATLGFHAVFSDMLWARAVVYFGGHYLTDKDYRWLYNILDAVTTLDPQNILAYRFGGTLLALEKNDVEEAIAESIAILKKGIQNNPYKDWRLYFLLGFNYFYFLEDYVSAAKYLEIASKLSLVMPVPAYLPRLVARMYARAEKIDTAIEFLEKTYQQYEDENVKSVIAERLNILIAKKYARSLKPTVEKYFRVYGKYPEDAKALVHAGLIKELLMYPGGKYVIDSNTGEVDWVSELSPQWP